MLTNNDGFEKNKRKSYIAHKNLRSSTLKTALRVKALKKLKIRSVIKLKKSYISINDSVAISMML